MPRQPNPAAALAEKLVQALSGFPEEPPYPPTLRELAAAVDRNLGPALVLKAASTKKPFAARVWMLQAKNLDSPLALKEEEQALLESDRALIFLVEQSCTPSKPLIEAGKLRTKVPKPVREVWDQGIQDRLTANRFPKEITPLLIKRKNFLHLNRYPLPPSPEETLAEGMLHYLRARRLTADYPLTLEALHRAAAPDAPAALLKKALALPSFKQEILLGMKAHPAAPIALKEDRDRLLGPLLLLGALRQARSGIHQAVNVADLKKKVTKELQAGFGAALLVLRAEGALPAGVGSLMQKKTPLFFFLDDVIRGQPSRIPLGKEGSKGHALEEEDLAAAFEKAFADLDRGRGGHNFVSLADLRQTLPATREVFDGTLRRLRQIGKYTLSAAEGRHGLSPEEREAALREDGALMLYVSKKRE